MCTIVLLRRPGHDWPLVIAANRDEMLDRPWRPPGRHWPERPEIVAGRDESAGGTWLGVNDSGLVAAVSNRRGSLGPAPGKLSRGALPLAALAHGRAADAAEALQRIDAGAYRAFNLVLADRETALWLRNRADGGGIERFDIPEGVSMVTAGELNDPESPRIEAFLPCFRAAPPPEPRAGDWHAWERLLASRETGAAGDPLAAMCIATDAGFGTVSSSLIALPGAGGGGRPLWRFAAGRPDEAPYVAVTL